MDINKVNSIAQDILINEKRKNLLINIDNGEQISDLELGMYELTTYYSSAEKQTLHEKILLLQNYERKIQHIKNKDFYFMPEQQEALNFIEKHSKVLLTAPTSFGKTLILKEYIYRCQPDIVVFIVPTNALAYELEKDFKTNNAFDNYKIFDKNKTTDENEFFDNEKVLFIGTQEKYLEIKESIKNANLFIIDEAYKLEENVTQQRAYKLSQAFLDSQVEKSDKVCLLSPNARFEGFDKYEFNIFKTKFNAVDKIYHTLAEEEFYNKLIEKAQMEKTIMFCESPNALWQINNELNLPESKKNKFIEQLEEEFHPEWTIVKLLKKGILCHDGLMPKYVQNKMINLFINDQDYKLLIGTNSISEGINTPTKNLFINKDCDIYRKKLLIKNTIGRAGRLGKYPIGHIYSVDTKLKELDEDEILIKLAIDDDDNLNELIETQDESQAIKLCNEFEIELEFYKNIIKKYKISLKRLRLILSTLAKDRKYIGLSNLPFMAQAVFKKDYFNAANDKYYINGILNDYYVEQNENKPLNGFYNKINYIKFKMPKITVTQAIDGYMKFIYSTLDYIICPIVDVAKELSEKYGKWKFGKNVLETINEFNGKYYMTFYGVGNFDEYSENEKKILLTLKEYGVNVKECGLDKNMLLEIENKLNTRFSTYDIIKTIAILKNSESSYKNIYKLIFDKYFN